MNTNKNMLDNLEVIQQMIRNSNNSSEKKVYLLARIAILKNHIRTNPLPKVGFIQNEADKVIKLIKSEESFLGELS